MNKYLTPGGGVNYRRILRDAKRKRLPRRSPPGSSIQSEKPEQEKAEQVPVTAKTDKKPEPADAESELHRVSIERKLKEANEDICPIDPEDD